VLFIPEDITEPTDPSNPGDEELSENPGAGGDKDYPLPDDKPIKYTDIDVVILPKGFKGEYPLPGGDSASFATDSSDIALDAEAAIETQEGFAKWEQVTIAKEMIQDYNGKKVFKSADSLRAMLDHGENRPITDNHPPGKLVTSNSQRKGYIENLTFTDEHELKADMIVTDTKLADEIKSGKKREVSIGFHAKIVDAHGVFADMEYDQIQIDMLLDHVASLENGRCSLLDGCGFKNPTPAIKQDSAPAPTVVSDEAKKAIELANSLIADQRIGLIAEISAINDTIDRDTLDAMAVDELKRLKTAIDTSSTSISTKPVVDLKSGIEAAYAKVGGQ